MFLRIKASHYLFKFPKNSRKKAENTIKSFMLVLGTS